MNEARGPAISLLNQWFTGSPVPALGVDVHFPDASAALTDLILLFALYVGEQEDGCIPAIAHFAAMFAEYARSSEGDFREFLQRMALVCEDRDDLHGLREIRDESHKEDE